MVLNNEHHITVYVDLENTIVDNFNTMIFLPDKINKLKKRLNLYYLPVSLFSYAIWCEQNTQKIIDMKDQFYEHGITFINIISTEQMFDCCKTKYNLTSHTAIWKLSKKLSFSTYVDSKYRNTNFMLFDDTVVDGVESTPLNNTIEWFNA